MKQTTIDLDGGDKLELSYDQTGGNFSLTMAGVVLPGDDDDTLAAALNGVFSLVLAQAVAGIDIDDPTYQKCVVQIVEQMFNEYD